MRRPDASSTQIDAPDRIGTSFQVSSYSGEPLKSILPANLLASDDWRAALRNEAVKLRPKVSFIVCSGVFSSLAEGLAGT
jgi:hypothetical protein